MSPANENHRRFDVSASYDGYVIRDARGYVVQHFDTLTEAKHRLSELQNPKRHVRKMLSDSVR